MKLDVLEVRRQRSRVSQGLRLRRKGGLCIIVLGSIRSPKGRSDSEGRKILDREVVQPQGEQGGCIKWYQRRKFLLADSRKKRKRDKEDNLISSRGISIDLSVDFRRRR